MKEELCDHCQKPIGVSVIYDHGKRYHPDCYGVAYEEKMRKMVSDTVFNEPRQG
jgi:hypothetical protein